MELNSYLKKKIVLAFAAAIVFVSVVYICFFAAPKREGQTERFIVPVGQTRALTIEKLKSGGYFRSAWAFSLLAPEAIKPGGYRISKALTARQLARVFSADSYMKWVTIPEGYRKEEIADSLSSALGWSDEIKKKWLTEYTVPDKDHAEGVYFPETYLISKEETPAEVASRLRSKFEERFAPYAKEAVAQNIKWTTLIKVASIVQREAAGKADMPTVAAVIWNRLGAKMRLGIDATLQYVKGNSAIGWWPPITASDKQSDSPYNSYRNDGLPPTPISNPGVDAIAAALHPAKSSCLYYIHDKNGQIYCAETYEEHMLNIEKYLK
jgi:UPF0755 protein